MSIKEFIRQTAGNEPDNIRNIRINKPQKELPFDPEIDISESDWQQIEMTLENFHEKNRWWYFTAFLMDLKIVDPKRAKKIIIDDKCWKAMKKILDRSHQTKNSMEFLSMAMRMKILNPEKTAELWLDEETFQRLIKHLPLPLTGDFYSVAAMELLILYPKKEKEIQAEENWEKMKGILRKLHQEGMRSLMIFCSHAMAMRLLVPQKFHELNISQQMWKEIKRSLEFFRFKKDWFNFLLLAMAMKILAANKVEVTENGLEITMRPQEEYKEKREPRPTRLSFLPRI